MNQASTPLIPAVNWDIFNPYAKRTCVMCSQNIFHRTFPLTQFKCKCIQATCTSCTLLTFDNAAQARKEKVSKYGECGTPQNQILQTHLHEEHILFTVDLPFLQTCAAYPDRGPHVHSLPLVFEEAAGNPGSAAPSSTTENTPSLSPIDSQ